MAENEIKDVTSFLTVLDGRLVLGGGDYSALAPALPDILPVRWPIKYCGGYHETG